MRHRIDPLIAERAPWLFSPSRPMAALRHMAEHVLSYPQTLDLGQTYRDLPASEVMADLATRLAQDVSIKGLDHIPRTGPALVVVNHPTGIADGIMMHHALSTLRPDLFIYANCDILRVLPQFDDLILPVEWRANRRSHSKTRATMCATDQAIKAGRLGVIFPSGRLAKRRGLRLFERDWMPSAAMIARKYDLLIIPVNIAARNSALFYLLDLIHPTLRDITLFHETLNKDRQPFRIRIGEPIAARALPARSCDAIEVLKRATLALGEAEDPTVSLVKTSGWLRRIKSAAQA